MKNLFTIAVAVIFAMLLVGCASQSGGGEEKPTSAGQQEGATQAATETANPETAESTSEADAQSGDGSEAKAQAEAESNSESESQSSSLFASAEWPSDNPIAQSLPTPSFSNRPSSASTYSSSIDVGWDQVDTSEVEAYVQSLKDSGFVHDITESKGQDFYLYGAANRSQEEMLAAISETGEVPHYITVSINYHSDGRLSLSAHEY